MDIEQLSAAIRSIVKPIIEVAGPTLDGYEFLTTHAIILPSKPIVTNVAREVTINPFSSNPINVTVDEVVDVKAIPYAPNSIGMFMTSCLQIDDKDINDRTGYSEDWKQKVLEEYDQILQGNLDAVNHALHLQLYRNASKALVPGGLLLQAMPFYKYEEAAQVFGLRKIFEETGEEQTVVFIKE